jgi:hypothetical protein
VPRSGSYLTCRILGTALPLSQFIPWIADNSLNVGRFLQAAFATRIAAFARLDVIVSAVVALVFTVTEGRRAYAPYLWTPFLAMCVSLALPLFLLLHQLGLEQIEAISLTASASPGR